MTEKRELTCIGCPMGCSITVTLHDGAVEDIKGFTCKRGLDYAGKEVTHPTRIVTSTVPVTGGTDRTVSVKTRTDIPKGKIFACMEALKGVTARAPVRIGDVIVPDAAGTGVDIVATGNVARA